MARHDLPFIIYKYFFISAILLVIVRSDWSGMKNVPKYDGMKFYFNSRNRKT